MFTVLIQSKKTMNSLQQFYPILSESIEEERIGVCQWIESGTTVDTAVPELYEMISRKRAWRAIVVCGEHDEIGTKYPASLLNPFDYLENEGRDGLTIENGKIKDCEAPLIRLTHLLGGIPSPEPKFEPRIIESPERVPRMEYHPVENEEIDNIKKAYVEWNAEYAFQGLPPSEIVLVKLRSASVYANLYSRVNSSWKVHTEADSSEFWKRNLYPHNCRFLVYDMDKRGLLKQQQDFFKFWVAILLLSTNDIDPNVLQAHRLYSLNVILDEESLANSFQQTVNKLNMAKYQLEGSLEKDAENESDEEAKAPEYAINIPVSFQLPKASDIHFDQGEYKLTGGAGSNDLDVWEDYRRTANKELQTLVQSIDRTLDQASSRMRGQYAYAESEVVHLNKYQERDFTDSLAEVYEEMIRDQAALPTEITEIEERLDGANKVVREAIMKRVSRKQAFFAVLVDTLVTVACVAPGLIDARTRLISLIVMLCSVGFFIVAELIILVTQRSNLVGLSKDYEMVFQDTISEISHNASIYSDFFSNVASHIHGSSYLKIMRQKQIKRDSSYFFKKKHLKAIDLLLAKLSLWSSAFHIDIDLKSVDAVDDDTVNGIDFDSLYSFDVGKDYVVPLNHTGVDISSPFGFIERFEIEREEVYDDAN